MELHADKKLAIFSLSHLAVDFACFFLLMGSYSRSMPDINHIGVGFLLYNFIAFALQIPFGYLADLKSIRLTGLTMLGCLLVAAALLLPISWPWVALCVCALGNALFHVGAGIDSLVNAAGGFSRSGQYISFGAVGVALGTVTGRTDLVPRWAILLVFVVLVALQWVICASDRPPCSAAFSLRFAHTLRDDVVVYLSMLGIVIRALVGATLVVSWKGSPWMTILPALCVFAGKWLGGCCADRLGARGTAVVSLALSAPLLSFFSDNIALCCAGLLFFNMTTSITLCVISAKLPENPGFAFGLTTLVLFVGSTIGAFIVLPAPVLPVTHLLLIALSAILSLIIAPKRITA